MAVVKNLNSNYTITNKVNPLANVIVETHTMFVNGNLLVGGNTTQVTKTDLYVTDNLITVNKGETGSGVTLGRAGLEVDRGSSANVQIIYNESSQKWQITNDGTIYYNIVSTSSASGLTAVVDDTAPALGGNLDTYARSIFSSNVAYVKFDNNLAIKTTTVAPTAIANYNIVYAQMPNSGGSGLYVTNTTTANQELATQTRNIAYSIIFSS
jgi:hypothetical protein